MTKAKSKGMIFGLALMWKVSVLNIGFGLWVEVGCIEDAVKQINNRF